MKWNETETKLVLALIEIHLQTWIKRHPNLAVIHGDIFIIGVLQLAHVLSAIGILLDETLWEKNKVGENDLNFFRRGHCFKNIIF